MNFVLFHVGDTLPGHIRFCIKQIQYTNPGCRIYIITNIPIVVDDENIIIVDIKTLPVPDIGTYYLYDAMSALFRNSMLRIFYLESFLNVYKDVEHIVHFDNDVLIYKDVRTFKDKLDAYDFSITPAFETEYVFGFCYIKNNETIRKVNSQLLELVRKGEHQLKDLVNTMPHEMRLLRYVNSLNNDELITHLPTTPSGVGSDNFDVFNMCFDPSSYGQYLGGHPPETVHYIGRQIIDKRLQVSIIDKQPIVTHDNKTVDICNLHIHNKKLKEFISYTI